MYCESFLSADDITGCVFCISDWKGRIKKRQKLDYMSWELHRVFCYAIRHYAIISYSNHELYWVLSVERIISKIERASLRLCLAP